MFGTYTDPVKKVLMEKNSGNKKVMHPSCDGCMYYEYDDEYGEYYCAESFMDEDDYARMAGDSRTGCPYYRPGNEYTIVRKQI